MKTEKEKVGRALGSYLETLSKPIDPVEPLPPSTMPITSKMDLHLVYVMDKLAAQIGESRSAFMQRVLSDSVFEIASYLGKWEEWNTEYAKLGLEGKKQMKEAV